MGKIYVGKSNIHGKGIFAERNIKKGEIVCILKGKAVVFEVKNKKDSECGPNWVGIGKDKWIDPAPPFLYINHSCNPTVGIKGKVLFVALRNIKKDEEIVYDYSMSEIDPLWKMRCSCGQKNCRKIIRSIQFLPSEIYKKYLPYISTHSKRAYIKYNKNI